MPKIILISKGILEKIYSKMVSNKTNKIKYIFIIIIIIVFYITYY